MAVVERRGCAILTGPAGPVLLRRCRPTARRPGSCDPHRFRKAGAARRCPLRRRQRQHVAILTRSRRAGAAAPGAPSARPGRWLRSSPVPEGRCCMAQVETALTLVQLRSSPVPEGQCCTGEGPKPRVSRIAILTGSGGPVLHGRGPEATGLAGCDPRWPRRASAAAPPRFTIAHAGSCDPRWPRRASAAHTTACNCLSSCIVAILAGPGGPALQYRGERPRQVGSVAILAGPGGPALRAGRRPRRGVGPGCDPRWPRRASVCGRHDRRDDEGHPPVCALFDNSPMLPTGSPR